MSWEAEQTAKAGLAAGYGAFSGRTATSPGSSRSLRGRTSGNRRTLAILLVLAITAGATVTLLPAAQRSPAVTGSSIGHGGAVALPALASISSQIGAHNRSYWGRTHGAATIAQTSGGGLRVCSGAPVYRSAPAMCSSPRGCARSATATRCGPYRAPYRGLTRTACSTTTWACSSGTQTVQRGARAGVHRKRTPARHRGATPHAEGEDAWRRHVYDRLP